MARYAVKASIDFAAAGRSQAKTLSLIMYTDDDKYTDKVKAQVVKMRDGIISNYSGFPVAIKQTSNVIQKDLVTQTEKDLGSYDQAAVITG